MVVCLCVNIVACNIYDLSTTACGRFACYIITATRAEHEQVNLSLGSGSLGSGARLVAITGSSQLKFGQVKFSQCSGYLSNGKIKFRSSDGDFSTQAGIEISIDARVII